eukprot:scaffold34661_cov126-Amphora_coffeaeformis.AAC.1
MTRTTADVFTSSSSSLSSNATAAAAATTTTTAIGTARPWVRTNAATTVCRSSSSSSSSSQPHRTPSNLSVFRTRVSSISSCSCCSCSSRSTTTTTITTMKRMMIMTMVWVIGTTCFGSPTRTTATAFLTRTYRSSSRSSSSTPFASWTTTTSLGVTWFGGTAETEANNNNDNH